MFLFPSHREITMKQKYSYLKVLWFGIGLWALSALARLLLSLLGNKMHGQDQLLTDLSCFRIDDTISVALFYVIFVIAVPVLEEFLFRYWIISKKTVVTISLFFAMSCYVAVGSFWWLGLVSFFLLGVLFLLFRGEGDNRNIFLMVASSAVFAMAHVTGFSSLNVDAVLCMSGMFGLAMVACWLTYNVGFRWACWLHVVNNFIVLSIVIWVPRLTVSNVEETRFKTPYYSAKLEPLASSMRKADFLGCCKINDSTLEVYGSLPDIALYLIDNFSPDAVPNAFLYSSTEYFKVSQARWLNEPYWRYTLTFHDTIPYGHAPHLVSKLSQHSQLHLDTTYEDTYFLGIDDTQRLNETKGNRTTTLAGLAAELRYCFKRPFVLEKGINEYFPVSYDENMLQYDSKMDVLDTILGEMGLYMYQSGIYKIQVVNIYDCDKDML